MQSRLSRAESPEELFWNLTEVYATADEWEADARGVEDAVSTVTAFRGHIRDGSSVCLECLHAKDELQAHVDKVSCYAVLLMLADATSPDHQEVAARASRLASEFAAALGFVQSEIAALAEETLAVSAGGTGVGAYRSQIERVRAESDHTLSEETEATLADPL